ncbi:MAG: UDP-N-acetylglucosamine 1-carboxyvinyltransferase [Pseudomonadota bacterium]
MTIAAFLPVFNEENRIKDTLDSLMWCDEIIIVDKYSTDRTVQIASGFGEKVSIFQMKNTDAYDVSELEIFMEKSKSDWVILFTASNVIHPNLVIKIKEKIKDVKFNYDVLHIPFRRFVLGLDHKRSPWHSELNPVVLRKTALSLDKNEVHNAIQKKGKHFKFEYDENDSFYRVEASNLQGCYMLLDEASVTGTANIVMAAVMAKGTTTIYNAACEPYIQQLCKMCL